MLEGITFPLFKGTDFSGKANCNRLCVYIRKAATKGNLNEGYRLIKMLNNACGAASSSETLV